MYSDDMQVVRCDLLVIGPQNPMVIRPYETNLTTDDINEIDNATKGGSMISAASLAGAANGVIRPSGQAQGIAQIANGWGEKRMVFRMEVHRQLMGLNTPDIQILTGYTDYVGVSANGHIDDNMMFYINNSISIGSTSVMGATGQQNQMFIRDAKHILTDSIHGEQRLHGQGHTPTTTMRPMDIFANHQVSAWMGTEAMANTLDTRSSFDAGVVPSSRTNDAPMQYLSKTLKAYKQSNDNAQMAGDEANDVVTDAMGTVKESTLAKDPFFYGLRNQSAILKTGALTWGQLKYYNPHIDSVTQVFGVDGQAQRQFTPEAGQTQNWNGSDMETMIATIIGYSLPALMFECLMTKVALTASNATADREYAIAINQAEGFSQNIQLQPYVERLMFLIRSQILNDITRNNQIQVNLRIFCDLLVDTTIFVSYNGGPEIPYVFSSFCDALTAPVIAPNRHNLETVAHDIIALGDNFGQYPSGIYTGDPVGMSGNVGNYTVSPAPNAPTPVQGTIPIKNTSSGV